MKGQKALFSVQKVFSENRLKIIFKDVLDQIAAS